MYNNYPNYPVNYMPNNSIQYVNGIESVQNYKVDPNNKVLLMDANNPIFYVKSADASGMPTVRKFKFEEVFDTPTSDYVTKQEFEELKAQIMEYGKVLNELK